MKTTKRQEIIDAAARLFELRAKMRELDKEEAAIKTALKGSIVDSNALLAGIWLVTLTERTRRDWDRLKLQALFGEKIGEYQTETAYTMLEVKRA